MARRPRSETAPEGVPGRYTCVSYCVRRENLCGRDGIRNRDVSHRKERLRTIVASYAQVFAVAVRHVDFVDNKFEMDVEYLPQLVEQWSDWEVLSRACLGFPNLVQKWCASKKIRWKRGQGPPRRLLRDKKFIEKMRKILGSLSKFQKMVKQRSAAEFNREDGVKGCFWSGRFEATPVKSSAGATITGLFIELEEVATGLVASAEAAVDSSAWDRFRGLTVSHSEVPPLCAAKRSSSSEKPCFQETSRVPIVPMDWYVDSCHAARQLEVTDSQWNRLLQWFGATWRAWRLLKEAFVIGESTVDSSQCDRQVKNSLIEWLRSFWSSRSRQRQRANRDGEETWANRLLGCRDDAERLAAEVAHLMGISSTWWSELQAILSRACLTIRVLLEWCEALLVDRIRAGRLLCRVQQHGTLPSPYRRRSNHGGRGAFDTS